MWHLADLMPDWKDTDPEWEAEIERAIKLGEQGIDPFEANRVKAGG